ncbi:unnamed protein product [Phytomonas sp. EM1]|nr:unnamed protein product [Phytomonas sp. EM1]|eukprot:CCW65150.1 unnamed protein product [Phytomonas sp. isolate EM1]
MAGNLIYKTADSIASDPASEPAAPVDVEAHWKGIKTPFSPAAPRFEYIQPPTFGVRKRWPMHGFSVVEAKETPKTATTEG